MLPHWMLWAAGMSCSPWRPCCTPLQCLRSSCRPAINCLPMRRRSRFRLHRCESFCQVCLQYAVLHVHMPAVLDGQLAAPYLAAFDTNMLQKDLEPRCWAVVTKSQWCWTADVSHWALIPAGAQNLIAALLSTSTGLVYLLQNYEAAQALAGALESAKGTEATAVR